MPGYKPHVLIVTPFFAPQTHAAVFRAYRLAKWLPDLEFKVSILTTDHNYNYKENPALLEGLKVEGIHRASYIEPSWRGLKSMISKKDYSYKATGSSAVRPKTQQSASSLKRIYKWVQKNRLNTPDPFWPWAYSAGDLGSRLIESEKIDIVYTSCYPYSSNLVGRQLQKKGVKWVADFRDPLTFCHRTSSEVPLVYSRQREIEKMTFEYADRVVGLSSCYRLIYAEMYPALQRVEFIPTGVEVPDQEVKPRNTIVYPGEYLPTYDGRFFEIFARALKQKRVPDDSLVQVIGYTDINRPRLQSLIDRCNLGGHVEFIDHLPQKDMYRLIMASRAGLLNPGADATWWTNYAKMVDFIAFEKPVVASVAAIGEARSELIRSGLGVFLDGPDDRDIDLLSGVFAKSRPTANSEYCKRYRAERMVQDFSDLFRGLLGSKC